MKKILIVFSIVVVVTVVILFMTMKESKEKIALISNPDSTDSTNHIETSQDSLNNVGNIRKSGTIYQGEIDSPSQNFKSFSSIAFGYRAMIQILRAYYKQGFKTLSQQITHYAPPSDNNPTGDYILFVENTSGVPRNLDLQNILYSEDVQKIVAAMAIFEQGTNEVVQPASIRAAYDMLT